MLVTFNSKHSPDVLMFGNVATVLLQAMGASSTPPGILRGESIKVAAEKLRHYLQALPEDSKQEPVNTDADEDYENEDSGDKPEPVSMDQRALPLLEMLDAAYKNDDDVIWR